MNLFRCESVRQTQDAAWTTIETPLGTVELVAGFGDRQLSAEPASSVAAVGESGQIVVWERPECRLELLSCPHVPSGRLFEELRVTRCWLAIWRVRALEPLEPCLFGCRWLPDIHWKESSPDSEEYFYARTWRNRRVEVVIGTEDDEALLERAESSDWLPKAWTPCFTPIAGLSPFWDHPAHYPLDAGLSVPLPGLPPGQRCQVQFAIAWGSSNRKTSGAWLAAQVPVRHVLCEAGCG